jgi:hypothetical protein
MLSHGKIKALGLRRTYQLSTQRSCPKKSVYKYVLFNANRIRKKHNAKSTRFLRQLQMQNQRIMGENPRVGIKPETKNSELWAKR